MSGGAFLELSFDLGPAGPEAVEDAAFGCGAIAVTFVDAQDDPVLEPAPGEMRLWPATRVRCLFECARPDEPDPEELVRRLAATLGIDASRIERQQVADRIWEREWLKDFHARRYGRRLWICPDHEQVSAADALIVHLDPGLAFGTGTHATTALCLTWLDAHPPLDARVVDYGCGSGVLGIAAARLGAAEVHAFDIDPQALIATQDNACKNGLTARLTVHASAASLPAQNDLLLANILAAPLCDLAASFASLVRPGGRLLLAGLMEQDTTEVTAAYAAWFDVARFAARDGWVCLAGRRR